MNEPKFQWSKFSPDRSEQFVIRTDDYTELIEKRDAVIKLMPQGRPFPDDDGDMATPPEAVQATAPVCPTHSKTMTKGKWGWFCKSKVGEGWCKYKPPQE